MTGKGEWLTECGRNQSWEQLNFGPAASWDKRASVGLAVLGESFETMALHLFLSHMICYTTRKIYAARTPCGEPVKLVLLSRAFTHFNCCAVRLKSLVPFQFRR